VLAGSGSPQPIVYSEVWDSRPGVYLGHWPLNP